MKTVSREVAAALCALLLGCGAAPLRGQGQTVSLSEIAQLQVKVGVGKSRVINVDTPIVRVSVADPEIADVVVASPTQILVNGKALGETSLVIWDQVEKATAVDLAVHSNHSYKQIQVKVRFAEVDRRVLKELGFDFLVDRFTIKGEPFGAASFAGRVERPSLPLTVGENTTLWATAPEQTVSARIKALEERGLVTTLAEPNLTAIDGQEASFLAGGEFPIPVVQGGGAAFGQATVTIVFKEFGVRLNFTPTVIDSGLINLQVAPEVSSLDFQNGIELSGFRIPALISRKASTAVEMREGEVLAIGGLLSNELSKTVSKIPFLGDVPILGTLFRSSSFQQNRTELVILMTPSIHTAIPPGRMPELPGEKILREKDQIKR